MGERGALPAVKKQPIPRTLKTIKRPDDLPEEAVKTWDILARHLAIAGRLQPEDSPALEKFCRAFALYRTIQAEIETVPIINKLVNGTITINQHFKALEIVDKEIERGIRHFGLSPATRGALNAVSPDSEIEEFDDFLAGRPTVEAPD
jgi:P27 family predicted phage terminase small subunit